MEQEIKRALAAAKGDYVEIRIHRARGTTIAYSGRELEDIGERTGIGGCVRVLHRGGWGFASFNDIENLAEYVGIASEAARMVGGGAESLAPLAPARAETMTQPDEHPDSVSLAEKKELCAKYNSLLLNGSPKVQTSSVRYADSRGGVFFGNSEGAYVAQEVSFCGIQLVALARDGVNVQYGHHSVGDLSGFQITRGLEAECAGVVKRAVDLLAAEPVKGGRYTVIMDPKLSGVFVHEAFGHLSEADFIYENERLREMMTIGRRFGNEQVTVIDDPTIPRLAGSYEYDSEGTPARPSCLLKQGVLHGRLHSRETAVKMNEPPSGNARAISHSYAPIVRMSNTYMAAGESGFEDMLAGVGDGLYAVGFLGGQTNMEMFTFSAEEAYVIKNGKIGRKVRDLTLTGNVFETLMRIECVGNDVYHYGGLGGCGKGGQSPLRVSSGGPHIRVGNVLIGGRG